MTTKKSDKHVKREKVDGRNEKAEHVSTKKNKVKTKKTILRR